MIELDRENFKEEILETELPVLVVFWRPGCGACSTIFSILKEVFEELGDTIKVAELNILYAPEIAEEYKIPAVPTLIILKNGKIKERAVGPRSKDLLVERMKLLIPY